ncbi:hypothetical protein HPP92_001242 [Vanilla planifolia]|uniref:Uncharacterized protein n=1 Tax=Vanilla planifolia TaxID=51239 RepID=A0A835RYX8_VANPL|nr:hypothetical protein HPP92_001242 [Vanilla planifolia]
MSSNINACKNKVVWASNSNNMGRTIGARKHLSALCWWNGRLEAGSSNHIYMDDLKDLVRVCESILSLIGKEDERVFMELKRSSVGKSKGGQVSKIVEISSVGLYCNAIVASQEPPDIPSMADSQKYYRTSSDFENCNFFLHPFDVKLSLLANKSGKIGSALQYVVDINTTTLVISLTEISCIKF